MKGKPKVLEIWVKSILFMSPRLRKNLKVIIYICIYIEVVRIT